MNPRAATAMILTFAMLLSPVIAFPPGDLFGTADAETVETTDSHSHDGHDHDEPDTSIIRDHVLSQAAAYREGEADAYVAELEKILCSDDLLPCTIPLGHDDDPIPDEHEHIICDFVEFPAFPEDGECNEERDDYTPPGGGPGSLPDPPEDPADSNAIWNATQEAILIAYDTLALGVNAAGAAQAENLQLGRTYMTRGSVDQDNDGIPDFYEISVDTTKDCKRPESRSKDCHSQMAANNTVYLQSDFVYGYLSNQTAMIVDPTSGRILDAEVRETSDGDGLILVITRNGEDFGRIIIDATGPEGRQYDQVVIEIVDPDYRYLDGPRWPLSASPLGIVAGKALVWAVPFDLGYVRILSHGDMDGDRVEDYKELAAGSNPLNPRSTPSNIDGDLCDWRDDPDDSDPAVCIPFPYEIDIITPDLLPDDDSSNLVYGSVPITFSFERQGAEFPEIAYYELMWTDDALQHRTNRTVDKQMGGTWPAECDFDDDTEAGHDDCGFFSDPSRANSNPIHWVAPTLICRGTGEWTTLTKTCITDTTSMPDSEYHIFLFLCMKGEDCAQIINQGLDIRDHMAWTPHVLISNKPMVQVHDVVDLDGLVDRTTVQYSGDVRISFDTWDVLGNPLSFVNITPQSYTINREGKYVPLSSATFTFNVLGMTEGETRTNVTGRSLPANATATITLVDEEDHTYEVITSSADWPRRAGDTFGKINFGSRAYIDGAHSPEATTTYPAGDRDVLYWFTNRAPEITTTDHFLGPAIQDLPQLGRDPTRRVTDPETGITTVYFPFHFKDPDAGSEAPTLLVEMLNETGTQANVTEAACQRDLSPGTSGSGENTRPKIQDGPTNSGYSCKLETLLFGAFEWQVTGIDTDAGDNTTVAAGPAPVTIANEPPVLEDGEATTAPEDTQAEGPMDLEFKIRYRDAEDAPRSVTVDIYTTDDPPVYLETVTLEESLTCNNGFISPAEKDIVRDLCGSTPLEAGEYNVKFHAESIRPGEATFPVEGLMKIVHGIVEIECPYCGSDEEHLNEARDVTLSAIETANDALEQAVPLPNVWNQLSPCPSCYNPETDPDGDHVSTEDEIKGGSDPYNPWSNNVDRDADLVPNVLEETVLGVDMMYINNGTAQLKEQPSVKVYLNTAPGAKRGPPVLNVTFFTEGEFYTAEVTTAGGTTSMGGLLLVDYEVRPTSLWIRAVDHQGVDRLILEMDADKIGTNESTARLYVMATGTQIYDLGIHTNPIGVTNNGDVLAGVPAGVEKDGEDYQLWVDEDEDGNRTYLLPDLPQCVPEDLPSCVSPELPEDVPECSPEDVEACVPDEELPAALPASLRNEVCGISPTIAAALCQENGLSTGANTAAEKLGETPESDATEKAQPVGPVAERLIAAPKDGGRS